MWTMEAALSERRLTHARQRLLLEDERDVEDEAGHDEEGGVEVLDLRRVNDGPHHQVHRDDQHDDGDDDRHLEGGEEGKCYVLLGGETFLFMGRGLAAGHNSHVGSARNKRMQCT